jgi:excinuclease ABC subunit B
MPRATSRSRSELVEGVRRHDRTQVPFGVTGSGKTFTMAKATEATSASALILAPIKTLAAQLYGEFRASRQRSRVFRLLLRLLPAGGLVPRRHLHREESSINEQTTACAIRRTRCWNATTLIGRSVSCIYGIGWVETHSAMTFALAMASASQAGADRRLVALQYKRTAGDFSAARSACAATPRHLPGAPRGSRLAGNLFGDEVRNRRVDHSPATRPTSWSSSKSTQFALRDAAPDADQAISGIKQELRWRLDAHAAGRLLEAQRLEQRTIPISK